MESDEFERRKKVYEEARNAVVTLSHAVQVLGREDVYMLLDVLKLPGIGIQCSICGRLREFGSFRQGEITKVEPRCKECCPARACKTGARLSG